VSIKSGINLKLQFIKSFTEVLPIPNPNSVITFQKTIQTGGPKCACIFLDKINYNTDFLKGVLFSEEANFYVNGEVNKQCCRYWSRENFHWYIGSKQQGLEKLMVWSSVWNLNIAGPFFFKSTAVGED
jgi:hypothetical protein